MKILTKQNHKNYNLLNAGNQLRKRFTNNSEENICAQRHRGRVSANIQWIQVQFPQDSNFLFLPGTEIRWNGWAESPLQERHKTFFALYHGN